MLGRHGVTNYLQGQNSRKTFNEEKLIRKQSPNLVEKTASMFLKTQSVN